MRDPYTSHPPRVKGFCDEPTCCAPIPETRRKQARFCSKPCYKKYHTRSVGRGFRLYETAMRWRCAPRSHTKGAKNPPTKFGDVTALLDEFLREDREMRIVVGAEFRMVQYSGGIELLEKYAELNRP